LFLFLSFFALLFIVLEVFFYLLIVLRS